MSWSLICLNGSSFEIIDSETQSLKQCFIQTILLSPSYLIFAIINAYLIGISNDLSRNFKNLSITLLRWITSLLLIVVFIELICRYFINISGNYIYLSDNVNNLIVSMIKDVYSLIALLLHTFYVFNKDIYSYFSRGLIFSFLPIMFANFINLINVYFVFDSNKLTQPPNEYKDIEFILLTFFNFFLLIYIIVVMVSYKKNNKLNVPVKRKNVQVVTYNIQNEENSHENDERGYSRFESLSDKRSDIQQSGNYSLNITHTNNLSKKLVSFDSEEDSANYYSYLTFQWLRPLLKKGFRRQINSIHELIQLPNDLNVRQVSDRFMDKYTPKIKELDDMSYEEYKMNPILDPYLLLNYDYIERNTTIYEEDYSLRMNQLNQTSNISRNNLIIGLLKCFGRQFFLLGFLKLFNDSLNFAGPLLLNQLVTFVETDQSDLRLGATYAAALFLSTLISSIINIHFTNSLNKLCLRIKAALISCIYRKAVLVKLNELNKHSIGQIVNYMSIDSNSITNAFPSFHQIWSLPFQISITLYLLYSQIGLSFLVGVGFVIILIPINKVISDYIGKVQKRLMVYKDERVKIITEFLQGIRVIKFYSWENFFLKKIDLIRNKELEQLKAKKYLDAGCVYFWATTPILMSVLTFITYAQLGNKLTAAKVFTSLALFNMLISPLNSLPWVINGLVQAWVSLDRLQSFLNLENLNWLEYFTFENEQTNGDSKIIEIRNAEFKWLNKKDTNPSDNEAIHNEESNNLIQSERAPSVLRDISLKIKKGQLIGIIGKVGSGKTSLLHSLMAEIDKVNGEVRVDLTTCANGFAYVGQECWIEAMSVKNNILFGSKMDPLYYKQVIEACALGPDLQLLAEGDETHVGENGICLSGGQKARLSLSRACYAQDKEVFLLDDPLSAVDSHVAKHIYENCINGILKSKTRIISTHHIKYLTNADLVLVVDQSRIVESGTGQEIIPKYLNVFKDKTDDNVSQKSASYVSLDEANHGEEKEAEITTLAASESDQLANRQKSQDENIALKREQEIEEEEKEHGVIDLMVYKRYCKSCGYFLTVLTIISLTFMQTSRNLTDFWLSYWTEKNPGFNSTRANLNDAAYYNKTNTQTYILNPTTTVHFYTPFALFDHRSITESLNKNTTFFFIVYGSLCFANTLFTLLRAFTFAFSGIVGGKRIHTQLIKNISKARLKFFDNTPRGRILNRLSTDMYAIDDSLPFILNIFLANVFGLFGILIVTCYSLPWFSISLIPLSILYYSIQNYYRWTSREVKRLSSISLSPIYTHFYETISGMSTIRAFRQIKRFLNQNEAYLNNYIRAEYASMATSQWLSFRLQMISVLMITIVGFTAVFQHIYSTANASLIGLALSYILSVTGLLNGLITSFTETEKEMVSVERTNQFDNLESEQWEGTATVLNDWPLIPTIEFQSVFLRYKDDANYALENVCFSINAGEKIGICGRTGSGKSSLLMSLFRGTELNSGKILIDDTDIRSLNLSDLREKMSIIPQDPFLFNGTLRENLDPSGKKSDSELWNALEKCRLDEKVRNEIDGLDMIIEEKGKNLSSGQRQLLCLTRALLSNRKILCIDEATASVDFETDNFIQQTIRNEFDHVTVLTIAHRINTIYDYDKILVMDGGRVAEYDTVKNLLANKSSLFYNLAHEKLNK